MTGRLITDVASRYADRFSWLFEDVVGWLSPRIEGVEVTQSIQHYRSASHLTTAANQGADNSLRLVANKAAWVRVYVSPGLIARSGVTVSGTLELQRRTFPFAWNTVATLSPQPPGSVTAPTATTYDTQRSSVANTLNFVIPSNQFFGVLRLVVTLTSTSTGSTLDTSTVEVDACLRQTLRIRAILVSYNGPATSNPGPPAPPNLTLAAPTLANVQTTAGLAHRMMPVQATGSYVSAGTVVCDQPLDDVRSCAGCCSANWGRLLTRLTNQRTADGNRADVVYYGLLPTGIPLNVPGCGQGGLGSAVNGDQATFVHEIGHGYGFQHTPCGNTGAADPNYPTYSPHAMGSIGEYGLDIANGNVLRPQATRDYMSYCFPQWMSIYQHNRLIQHARLGQDTACVPPWWKDYFAEIYEWRDWPWPDPPPWDPWKWVDMRIEPIISITGIVQSAREIDVATVARVSAATGLSGTATRMKAVLLNEEGERLAEGRVVRLTAHGGCGCGGDHDHGKDDEPYNFQAFVPDVGPGASLVILDEAGEEIWARRAPKKPPRIGDVSAEVSKDGILELRWGHKVFSDESEAWVQWSADGEHWRGLATGIMESAASLPLEGVPAGAVQLRVLVHDGFSTAVSDPVEIDVPELGPVAAILHPHERQTLIASRTMLLSAAAADQSGEPLEDESCRWTLDGEEAGRGKEVWITAPRAGEHELVLTVVGPGEDARLTVRFMTVGDEDGQKDQQSAD